MYHYMILTVVTIIYLPDGQTYYTLIVALFLKHSPSHSLGIYM